MITCATITTTLGKIKNLQYRKKMYSASTIDYAPTTQLKHLDLGTKNIQNVLQSYHQSFVTIHIPKHIIPSHLHILVSPVIAPRVLQFPRSPQLQLPTC